MSKAFYPYTFPITVGPGCFVVMLTLSAHLRGKSLIETGIQQAGAAAAIALLAGTIYMAYAYASRLERSVSPSTAQGILRIIAFILLCIGVQIAWNGLSELLTVVIHSAADTTPINSLSH
jgi:multiple antibiotic resistance protein